MTVFCFFCFSSSFSPGSFLVSSWFLLLLLLLLFLLHLIYYWLLARRNCSPAVHLYCNRVYCIHVPGHDLLIFSSGPFPFDWVGVLWAQLSKVLKPVRWAGSVRVPGEIKRSRDLRGGRWSWTLTFAQKRSWVGRWSWAEQVGRLLLRVVQVVRQQRCNGHCLSHSVQHSSWKSNCAVHKSLGNGEGTPP